MEWWMSPPSATECAAARKLIALLDIHEITVTGGKLASQHTFKY